MAYLAILSRSLTSFTSVKYYLSILSHINQSLGYSCTFLGDYDLQLATRAVRRLFGDVKHAMTVGILLQILPRFDSGNIFHTCMAALFLVAFFSFLRIFNLVPCTLRDISNSHPLFLKRSDVRFSPRGAVLSIHSASPRDPASDHSRLPCPSRFSSSHLSTPRPCGAFLLLFGLYVNNQY